MKRVLDLDMILDLCSECRARPLWVHDSRGEETPHRVDCSECSNGTEWCKSENEAMIRWNKEQRGLM
jgi:hypothetical protein